MRKTVLAVLAGGVVALGAAAPAQAHPYHTACDPGASDFAKEPGPFGQFVRVFAQEGGVNEEVAALHLLCADAPGQP